MYILICTLVVMGSSCSEENLNLLFDLLYHLVLIIQEIFLINGVAAKLRHILRWGASKYGGL